ncbi:rRNA adenine N-6-methyltransferase family protein [Clostridium polynesiense]|uniref:rRNA adenine N-6-methyltransferase family protein n=1 Tax=Clostridium polynesiense TaxID=1325933 RepID=UPI000590D34A|nr:rRNA adenine N-6-methyltransferase family protein [Clostridium polynesiense]
MIPFNKDFLHTEIENYISKLNKEDLKYNHIEVSLKSLKGCINGYIYEYTDNFSKVPVLMSHNKELMKLSPEEIIGCYEAACYARGKVGIVGLGLGYFTLKVLENKNVKEVVVYESDEEVINFYYNSFGKNKKLKIIHGDAFKAQRDKFDFFFADIYYNKLDISAVEHYIAFNKLHEIEEYTFWGMERFLLSCSIEDILYIYIPELWMSMSKELFSKYNNSSYKDLFKPLPEDSVKEVLKAFGEEFNRF